MSIDATAGGALMQKSIETTRALLEEMPSNNYHWSSERATLKRTSGVYAVDAINLLASKVNGLAQRFDRLGTISSGSPAGSSFGECMRLGLYVRSVVFKVMLLLSANPPFRELSMTMLCKTSTYAHKITHT